MHTDSPPRPSTPARHAVASRPPVAASPGARILLTAVLVVCLALAGSVGAATAGTPPTLDTNPSLTNATATQPDVPTTSQSDAPTLTTTSASVEPGETTTVTVLLIGVPDGLAGYELVVSLSDDAATVTDATYPEGFGLTTDPQVSGDGSSVTLEAADTASVVEPGATNATLATVTISGESAGEVSVELDARQLDADGGGELSPATVPGTVTVGDPATATPSASDDTADRNPGSADAGEETSVTTALPLAGVGVGLFAVLVVAGLLRRRA